jgi:FkbM family methyltransferase
MIIHGADLINQDDKVVEEHRRQGFFEPESIATWLDHCQGTVIDVGAYTGIYSIVAAKAGANVVALEPNPEVYKRLIQNCTKNNVAIEALEVAAGSEIGVGRLNINNRPPLTSAGTLLGSGGIQVDVVALDSMELENITAVKIDVECYEIAVLEGARRIIGKYHPLLICEALRREGRDQLIDWMSRYPYRHDIADERNILFIPMSDS